jgi:hypothetical protein
MPSKRLPSRSPSPPGITRRTSTWATRHPACTVREDYESPTRPLIRATATLHSTRGFEEKTPSARLVASTAAPRRRPGRAGTGVTLYDSHHLASMVRQEARWLTRASCRHRATECPESGGDKDREECPTAAMPVFVPSRTPDLVDCPAEYVIPSLRTDQAGLSRTALEKETETACRYPGL